MNNFPLPSSAIELVIASTNVHKIHELKNMLKPNKGLDILSLRDFPTYLPPEETGATFEENAISKAVHAAQALNRWTLADDSGLIVPALRGSPGIFSARYAGGDASDLDNRKKLLSEMAHLLEEDRHAYFECCLALASPHGLKKVVRGTCEGMILMQEKGCGGFGYDSIFVKNGYNKTFGELEDSVKNRVSHRRRALDKLMRTFDSLLTA